jgi:hypothetical protein
LIGSVEPKARDVVLEGSVGGFLPIAPRCPQNRLARPRLIEPQPRPQLFIGGHSSSWSRPGPIQLEDGPCWFPSALTETPSRARPIRLRPIQRPFLGTGLSRAQGNQEPLRCGPVGINPFLKVSDRSTSSDYPTELSLLLPLDDRYPNLSHTQSEDSHACSQYSHSYC